eukprot:CAMPEP_0116567736 /NCGR_PEP_ID=MMETSP0397-20121206/15187_1 /TAXON_ID=216820 /ORGANISM="Cyclophora tenuis, Strain ECT3854" /LENGTH=67 /DNA_ID=CAMNT_0004094789 /DNA_START=72 /DNA_END=272 /DNA_ORIENTATION=+
MAMALSKKSSSSTSFQEDDDGFVARRSSRVKGEEYSKADGDSWQENLAVCEVEGGKLVIRSYFRNLR